MLLLLLLLLFCCNCIFYIYFWFSMHFVLKKQQKQEKCHIWFVFVCLWQFWLKFNFVILFDMQLTENTKNLRVCIWNRSSDLSLTPSSKSSTSSLFGFYKFLLRLWKNIFRKKYEGVIFENNHFWCNILFKIFAVLQFFSFNFMDFSQKLH